MIRKIFNFIASAIMGLIFLGVAIYICLMFLSIIIQLFTF
jgi:hypothetical protein